MADVTRAELLAAADGLKRVQEFFRVLSVSEGAIRALEAAVSGLDGMSKRESALRDSIGRLEASLAGLQEEYGSKRGLEESRLAEVRSRCAEGISSAKKEYSETMESLGASMSASKAEHSAAVDAMRAEIVALTKSRDGLKAEVDALRSAMSKALGRLE